MKPCCFSLWQWSGGVCPLIAIIYQLLLLGVVDTEQDGWFHPMEKKIFL
ncbi:hypothetical protein EVA_19696 [gut metagenome]|uniref:Uncharacterized protein n=1 Tax=gut metagenome TaxID=749906 RepID=J9FCP3_9ZZZZ